MKFIRVFELFSRAHDVLLEMKLSIFPGDKDDDFNIECLGLIGLIEQTARNIDKLLRSFSVLGPTNLKQ